MKQGEQILAAIGSGAAIIRELSNTQAEKIPHLTLLTPGENGRIINAGCSDQAVHDFPATSFELTGNRVVELYEFLRTYFDGKDVSK